MKVIPASPHCIKTKVHDGNGLKVEKHNNGGYYVSSVPKQRRQSLEFGVGDLVLSVNGKKATEFDNEESMNSLFSSWSDFNLSVLPHEESNASFSTPKSPSGKKKLGKTKTPPTAPELWSSRGSLYSPSDNGWEKITPKHERFNRSRASLVKQVSPADLGIDDEDQLEKIRRLNKERAENIARRKSEREEAANRRQSERVVRRKSVEILEEQEAKEEARKKADEAVRLKAKEQARKAAREKAEKEARLKREEEQARTLAKKEARAKAKEQARLKAEEEAQMRTAQIKAQDEEARQARKKAHAKARQERMRAEEVARSKAARAKAEAESRARATRAQAEEEARLEAEKEARQKAKEQARLNAKEAAKARAEEEAQRKKQEVAARRRASAPIQTLGGAQPHHQQRAPRRQFQSLYMPLKGKRFAEDNFGFYAPPEGWTTVVPVFRRDDDDDDDSAVP